MRTADLDSLREIDERTKGPGFNELVSDLLMFYSDNSKQLTKSRLEVLGLGVGKNPDPIEISMLRRIIDRIAVVYQDSPTRRLRQNGALIDESSGIHESMLDVVAASRYDLSWRRMDKLRSLLGQSVFRFYPSDYHDGVTLRIFTPDMVMREPSPHAPDTMDMDSRFALKLAGNTWEYWEKADSRWRMSIIDDKGYELPLDRQPLAEWSSDGVLMDTGMLWPEDVELPVLMVYDDWAGGRPWIRPRGSRLAWSYAINCYANELLALVRNQAHQTKVWKSDNPSGKFPSVSGPNVVVRLDKDDSYDEFLPSPAISECKDVLLQSIVNWLQTEDLPVSEFNENKQVVTGAALRVQERPLNQRMESLIPLAVFDEKIAWRKMVSVYNMWARDNDKPELRPDTEMEVQIADLVVPTDGKELLEIVTAEIAVGISSGIDAIQARYGISRPEAIERYERVKDDMDAYPIFDQSPQEQQTSVGSVEIQQMTNQNLASQQK